MIIEVPWHKLFFKNISCCFNDVFLILDFFQTKLDSPVNDPQDLRVVSSAQHHERSFIFPFTSFFIWLRIFQMKSNKATKKYASFLIRNCSRIPKKETPTVCTSIRREKKPTIIFIHKTTNMTLFCCRHILLPFFSVAFFCF